MPSDYERELREANRKVPQPGDQGVCTDYEPYNKDIRLIHSDFVEVQSESGERVWLPGFLFRKV